MKTNLADRHYHEPPSEAIIKKRFMNALKKSVKDNPMKTIPKVNYSNWNDTETWMPRHFRLALMRLLSQHYTEVRIQAIQNKTHEEQIEILTSIPAFKSAQSTAYNTRLTCKPPIPQLLQDIVLTGQYSLTVNNQPFVLADIDAEGNWNDTETEMNRLFKLACLFR